MIPTPVCQAAYCRGSRDLFGPSAPRLFLDMKQSVSGDLFHSSRQNIAKEGASLPHPPGSYPFSIYLLFGQEQIREGRPESVLADETMLIHLRALDHELDPQTVAILADPRREVFLGARLRSFLRHLGKDGYSDPAVD